MAVQQPAGSTEIQQPTLMDVPETPAPEEPSAPLLSTSTAVTAPGMSIETAVEIEDRSDEEDVGNTSDVMEADSPPAATEQAATAAGPSAAHSPAEAAARRQQFEALPLNRGGKHGPPPSESTVESEHETAAEGKNGSESADSNLPLSQVTKSKRGKKKKTAKTPRTTKKSVLLSHKNQNNI